MPDTIKTTNDLKVLVGFVDEDDRTITINNPKANLTWSNIASLESAAANVLIGDKYAAKFSRVKTAKYVDTTITTLDITQ